MKNILVILFLVVTYFQALAQTTHHKWYTDTYGDVYCGEYTSENWKIGNVNRTKCDSILPTNYKWFRDTYGDVYCGEYTPDNLKIRSVPRGSCDKIFPTYVNWFKDTYGDVRCGEYTPENWKIGNVDANSCRANVKNKQANVPPPKPLTIAEINGQLQPAENTQVIIGADIAIPRKAGCGAPKDADKNVQCYVCQKKVTHNSTLYNTKDEIIQIGQVSMVESRVDIVMELLDADDLGTILCRSKNNQAITSIVNLEGLVKALEDSGIKFKDPGYLVKKLNRSAPAATSQQQNLQDYEL